MSKNLSIVLAPDSFKESLSSHEVCLALEKGILRSAPQTEVMMAPIADGGEGTVDTLMTIPGSQTLTSRVTGPMGHPVDAKWGILRKSGTAVIEMAASSGLPLVPEEQRDPMVATTYGVGELILEAVGLEVKEILIGIGGSATNDGGAGMLQALGFSLLDESKQQIALGNGGLAKLRSIESNHVSKEVLSTKIIVASDVQNPLTGPSGASYVYGPQKGASEEMVLEMDKNLKSFGSLVSQWRGVDFTNHEGAGAAGGLGFAFLAFLNSELRSGFESIAELTRLEEKIKKAEWVVTGEGKLDSQTLQGKGPFGVAQMAKNNNKPVIAIGGIIDPRSKDDLEVYFEKIFRISPVDTPIRESIENAESYLESTGLEIAKFILDTRNL